MEQKILHRSGIPGGEEEEEEEEEERIYSIRNPRQGAPRAHNEEAKITHIIPNRASDKPEMERKRCGVPRILGKRVLSPGLEMVSGQNAGRTLRGEGAKEADQCRQISHSNVRV
jgi:hypothetical protein